MPLLLGLRLAARRPRRAVLSAASIAVTAAGIVAVLAFRATVDQAASAAAGGLGNPVVSRDEQMLMVLTVVLVALAVLNAICAAWATVLDARQFRRRWPARSARPRSRSAPGCRAAQVLPALPGALLGIPLGIGLFAVANGAGTMTIPPAWWLTAAVLGTLVAVAGLTSIPARIGARRPVGRRSSSPRWPDPGTSTLSGTPHGPSAPGTKHVSTHNGTIDHMTCDGVPCLFPSRST